MHIPTLQVSSINTTPHAYTKSIKKLPLFLLFPAKRAGHKENKKFVFWVTQLISLITENYDDTGY